MKVLSSLAISAFLMFAGSGASAQAIDDDTKCGAFEAFIQVPSHGYRNVKVAAGYIEETMRALDRLHGQRGKTEIFPQMNKEGRYSLVVAVISGCHSRHAITVADIAIEAYETARAAGLGLDSNKTAQMPVRTRYSRTAAPGQSAATDTNG